MIEAFVQIDSDDPNLQRVLTQMMDEGWKIEGQSQYTYPNKDKVELHYYFQKPIR